MSLKSVLVLAAITAAAASQAYAQSTTGTMVVVPAFGEVTHPNDEALAHFMIEEQDKDKTAAASRVNQKMKQGTEIIRKEDPRAKLKTYGYYTYPVYSEVRPLPNGTMPKPNIVGWRVGQYLEVKTQNLSGLPKTTAAAQKVLGLNGLNYGLSPETTKKLDEQRIALTYRNLNERIASIAKAMGRQPAEAVIDTVDFEGSGNYAGGQADSAQAAPYAMRAMAKQQESAVPEPSFEPGETTLQMRLVGKVKFK